MHPEKEKQRTRMSIIIIISSDILEKIVSSSIEDWIESLNNLGEKNHERETYAKEGNSIKTMVKMEIKRQIEHTKP